MIVEVHREYERWDDDESKFVSAVRELPRVSSCRGGFAFERVLPRRSVGYCPGVPLGRRGLRQRQGRLVMSLRQVLT